MFVQNDWAPFLERQMSESYMKSLMAFLDEEYATKVIYPKREQLFRAFELTPYGEIRVVILGQDPYHGEHQANGLSFSVNEGVKFPPSLRNIFKELVQDIGCDVPVSGDLSAWARQGVLLLNTTLSVEAKSPMSHTKKGWEQFTDEVLKFLNERKLPIVFILWGKHAQSKLKFIDENRHYVLQSAHPSPLSARHGFFSSQPFSLANELLEKENQRVIDWSL